MNVRKTLNYEYEALTLFSKLTRDAVRYGGNVSNDSKLLIDKIYDDARQSFETIKDQVSGITEFFELGVVNNPNLGLAVFVFKDFYEEKKQFNAHQFIEIYLTNMIQNYDGDQSISIMDILNQSGLDPNEKWYLLWLLSNPETVMRQINLILDTFVPIIKKHEKPFLNKVNEVIVEWQTLIDEGSIETFLDVHLGLKRLVDVKEYSVSILGNDTIIFVENKAFIGFQFTMEYFNSKVMNPDTVITAMKLMGDSSKYKILKELLSGKKYGRELAQNLGLTAATISYHIQELLNEGLVGASSNDQNNRIYYDIRKSKISEIINYVKTDLEIE